MSFRMVKDCVLQFVVTLRCQLCGCVVQERLPDLSLQDGITAAVARARAKTGAETKSFTTEDTEDTEGRRGGADSAGPAAGPGPGDEGRDERLDATRESVAELMAAAGWVGSPAEVVARNFPEI